MKKNFLRIINIIKKKIKCKIKIIFHFFLPSKGFKTPTLGFALNNSL